MNVINENQKLDFIKNTCDIIFMNEIGANKRLKYKFSDPDGKTGRSGWSFGGCQFDTAHNDVSVKCLAKIGFTPRDIEKIKAQTASDHDMETYNGMLSTDSARITIDKYDTRYMLNSINHCLNICRLAGFINVDPTILIFLVDYHNQLFLSKNGAMHKYMNQIESDDYLDIDNYGDLLKFKLSIKWGRDRPDDVKRRNANLVNILDQKNLNYKIPTSIKFA
jgi:hypothetical protein